MIKTTHNLIILDRSGSMSSIREQAIMGINNTLKVIRESAKDTGISQLVTLCSFCSCRMEDVYLNTPVEIARDLTAADYEPCCCTPLYDAIGRCCTRLEEKIMASEKPEENAVSVTIITDGYENASRNFTGPKVAELIERLKAKGWMFAFIGANIDVKKISFELKIDNSLAFESTKEGTEDMFRKEARSRKKWCSIISECESPMDMACCNQDYFAEDDNENDKF